MKKHIFISAGESSGDLHASNLIRELRELDAGLEFSGLGCDKMEAAGVRMLKRVDKHAIIGLWEVFTNIKSILDLFSVVRKEIDSNKTDLAILIDNPGFNLILAKILRKKNIPCIYYITPQIWAWGKWRINVIKKFVNKAIVIFDFEEDTFREKGIDATFVGHPLLDETINIPTLSEARSKIGIAKDKFTIALLPGSRPLEVRRILPAMIKASLLIRQKKDVQFIISKSPQVDREVYEEALKGVDYPLLETDIYTCLGAADFVLAASGTVTLQVAISEKPMLITYITSAFTYFSGKIAVRIPYIGLVNVIAGKFIVPEVLQFEARPKKLADTILDIISSEQKMTAIREDLIRIKEYLGDRGASKRAASIIHSFIQQ